MVPGSNRPFLDAGQPDARGHVNFRGRMFLESKTFGDDRVLLHIPQGFDPNRPAVMVVFFHGHGATLERDVRDRQRLPEQISAAGLNAVLVAPQFAFDAADFSAGKFWEPDGFKHFLDETAKKLAALYGDQRSAAAFANMPIVLVSYSGGFGPTLSVLARGGAQSRIRGLVLLDFALCRHRPVRRLDRRQPLDLLRQFLHAAYRPSQRRSGARARRALGALRLGAAPQSYAGYGDVPAHRRYLAPRFRHPCLDRQSGRGHLAAHDRCGAEDRYDDGHGQGQLSVRPAPRSGKMLASRRFTIAGFRAALLRGIGGLCALAQCRAQVDGAAVLFQDVGEGFVGQFLKRHHAVARQ